MRCSIWCPFGFDELNILSHHWSLLGLQLIIRREHREHRVYQVICRCKGSSNNFIDTKDCCTAGSRFVLNVMPSKVSVLLYWHGISLIHSFTVDKPHAVSKTRWSVWPLAKIVFARLCTSPVLFGFSTDLIWALLMGMYTDDACFVYLIISNLQWLLLAAKLIRNIWIKWKGYVVSITKTPIKVDHETDKIISHVVFDANSYQKAP